MKEDDLSIRHLGKTFELLDWSRRSLDQSHDDLTRADLDSQWLATARRIMVLQAATRLTLKTKARVLLGLIEATGAEGVVAEAARSLATDILEPVRFG